MPGNKGLQGLITFSKRMGNDNSFYLLVDKGTKRFFLDFFVGINTPRIIIDIAYFFNGSQSMYRYHSLESLKCSINKAIDLLERILPTFENEIKKIFQDGVEDV